MLHVVRAGGPPGEELLRSDGYATARWFIDMARPTLDDIVEPPMPDGLELRPVTPDQHETVWRANREAFRDHWGGSDESIEQLNRILGDPDTDTSLWLIAWDGDEVAGGVWNEIRTEENAELGLRRGWLSSVFTRRPWRKRGLASALIGQFADAAPRSWHDERDPRRRRRQPDRRARPVRDGRLRRPRSVRRDAQADGRAADMIDATEIAVRCHRSGLRFRGYRGPEDHAEHAPRPPGGGRG